MEKKTYSEIMRELDRQKNRKTVTLDINDKTYTIKNLYRMDAKELQYKLAEQLYDSIRKSDTDICDIGKSTNIKADNIKKCKDHLFYNKHQLDLYTLEEEAPKCAKFDANLKQVLN